MATPQEQEFQQRVGRIEQLVKQIDAQADPAIRAAAEELIQTILELHGAGLERMLDLVAEAGAPGEALFARFTRDDLVNSLLLLHGLHPLDLATRVGQALDKVRPYLGSHGGDVELLGVEEGVVHLRLQGSCNGCASSAMTLKLAIEEALQETAPDLAGLVVEGVVERPPPRNGFIPLTAVGGPGSTPASPGYWTSMGDLSALTPDAPHTLDVAGTPLFVCRVNDTFYAYANNCPSCGQALGAARLTGPALTCPGCGLQYDVLRAGRCLDQPQLHLEPFPLLLDRGQARVALPR